MEEVWKSVPGFEGVYVVSNLGRVKRLAGSRCPSDRLIATKPWLRGYFRVSLSRRGIPEEHLLHRLVYKVFVGPIPDGMTVNHKDLNKANNSVENLELMTLPENIRHGHSSGAYPRGERSKRSKLTEAAVREIRERKDVPACVLAKKHGVQQSAVCKVRRGEAWRHVGVEMGVAIFALKLLGWTALMQVVGLS